jgi:hypothetical protein
LSVELLDTNGEVIPNSGHTIAFRTTARNEAPTIATGATATPNPVTGTSTDLRVLGADDGGEANLTYSWSVTGTPPGPVAFAPNGTNASKNSQATFTKAGSYNLLVTLRDAGGLSVTSPVVVTVNQTLTTISVSPASVQVQVNTTRQFTGLAKDQFGLDMSVQPVFTWSVSGGGNISSSGLFTAGATAGGPFTVRAASGGESGTAQVSVTVNAPTNLPPVVSAGPDQTVTLPSEANLNGEVSDDGLPNNTLTTTWSKVSGPGVVTFGNANAVDTTARFGAAGIYVLRLSGSDGVLTASDEVIVSVNGAPPPPNQAPRVTMVQPRSGDQFQAPATVELAADATDGDGTIKSVDFYSGTALLGSATNPPYSYSWRNVRVVQKIVSERLSLN